MLCSLQPSTGEYFGTLHGHMCHVGSLQSSAGKYFHTRNENHSRLVGKYFWTLHGTIAGVRNLKKFTNGSDRDMLFLDCSLKGVSHEN